MLFITTVTNRRAGQKEIVVIVNLAQNLN